MFNLFKKRNPKILIPSLGEFTIIDTKHESIIEGNYNSKIFGNIKLSFPKSSNNVTEHQINTLKQIEINWQELKSKIPKGFLVNTIMIPVFKSPDYDVDAEIVLMNDTNNMLSAIIIDNNISEIIEIE